MKIRHLPALLAVALLCSCASTSGGSGARAGGSTPAPVPTPGSTAPSSAAPSAVSLPDDCVPPGKARVLQATVTGSTRNETLPVAVLGTGKNTVILSNESDEDLCSWLPLADHLTAAGYRVAIWNYGAALPPDELTAVTAAVRADGAGPVILMGASEGAKSSLIAGAGMQPPVVGIVSLSAESYLKGGMDVKSYIPKLSCPLLLLTAADDPYGSAPAAANFAAAARPGQARLLTFPGAAHGTALLQPPTATDAQTAVDGFLHSAFGSAG
jgi:fermentation-respiration switch protein FrsA (DUF1100 family)